MHIYLHALQNVSYAISHKKAGVGPKIFGQVLKPSPLPYTNHHTIVCLLLATKMFFGKFGKNKQL